MNKNNAAMIEHALNTVLDNLTELHTRYLERVDDPWFKKTAEDCLIEIAAINDMLKVVDKSKG